MGQSRTQEFLPYESLLLLPGIPEVPGDRAGGGKEKSKGREKEDSIGENWIRAAPAVSLRFFSPFLPIRNPSPLPIFLSAHSSWLGPPYQGTRHEYLQRARIDFPHRRSELKIKVDFPTSNGRFPLGKRSAIKISWPRDKGKTFLPSFHLDCKEGTRPHESFSSLASIPALFLIRLLSLIYAEEEEGSFRVFRTERSPD